jgi:hypothetical protein
MEGTDQVAPHASRPYSLRGGFAVAFALLCWVAVALAVAFSVEYGDKWGDDVIYLWLLGGLGALVVGIWALLAPKGPRDRTLGLLALGIFASQFLVAFVIAAAKS